MAPTDDRHDTDEAPIVHDAEQNRFAAHIAGRTAEITYRMRGDRMVIDHTGVPDELSGQGLAGRLVAAAVEHAAAEGLTVVPRCPYARSWLEEHTDAAQTVTIDWPATS
jgi:uncharacterized protein